MRGAGPSRSAASQRGRTQFQLTVIGLFSAGILFGYLFLGSPRLPHHGSTLHGTDVRLSKTELHEVAHATVDTGSQSSSSSSSSLKQHAPTPAAPQVGSVSAPPPLVTVTTHDQRHPENVKQIIQQASSQDEQKSGLIHSLITGRKEDAGPNKKKGAATGAWAELEKGKAASADATADSTQEADAGTSSTKSRSSTLTSRKGKAGSKGADSVTADADNGGGSTDGDTLAEDVVKPAVTSITGDQATVKDVREAAASAVNKAKDVATDLKEKAKDAVEVAADVAAGATKAATSAVGDAVKGAAKVVADTTLTAASAAGEVVMQATKKTARAAGDAVTQAAKATTTKVGEAVTDAAKATTSAAGSAVTSAAKATSEAVVEAGKALASQPRGPGWDLPGCKAPGSKCDLPGNTIHTLFTSNGSPYQNFQARIMIATWNLVRKMPGGDHLVAMTRILHRTTNDELMEEVDTFRAQPLQPECDKWCWFPVADRANAMQQWLDAVEKDPSMQKAPWLLLLETDYVWVKPLQPLGDAYDPKVPGLSFAFDYISPGHPIVAKILKDKCPTCDPRTVPNSGPAPVLARFEDFKAVTPMWEELSKWIETHDEAKKSLGWVREMYAWDIGVAAARSNIRNQGPGVTTLISQPPHDHTRGNATMYHYTWGSIVKDDYNNNTEVWKFDKRFYTDPKIALKVPTLELPPAWRKGLRLHDGIVVTQELRDTLADMLSHMNAGIETLPDLTQKAVANAAAVASS